jgi:hypothetical protein
MRMTAADANVLTVGQHLILQCAWMPAELKYAVQPRAPAPARTWVTTAAYRHASGGRAWGVSYGYPNYCGDGDGDGWDVSCGRLHPAAAPAWHRVYHAAVAYASSSGGYSGNVSAGSYSGFQACVIARESGGNSQVMNSTGHYGLYQFSASTWQAYGGSAASFGHASVAEQNAVFNTAIAQGGQSNWAPYDGC